MKVNLLKSAKEYQKAADYIRSVGKGLDLHFKTI
jgi:hypothetical protein